jgi:hypothetical protein
MLQFPGPARWKPAAERLSDVIHRQLCLFALAQDGASVSVKDLTGFGWRDTTFSTDQQLLIQFTFQSGYLLAQRRLRDMQHFSRLGQAADIDDFYEVFQSS